MPRRYQYQPLTGPVFVASVAATMAWLPCGNPYPTPAPPPRDAITVLEPIFPPAAPFDPAPSLAWEPRGNPYRTPALPPRDAWTVLEPPPAYDPASLTWRPLGEPRARAPELRDAFTILQPPPGDDPSFLAWQPQGAPRARDRRVGEAWIVTDPTTPSAVPPFDPSTAMPWWVPTPPRPLAARPPAGSVVLDPLPIPEAPPAPAAPAEPAGGSSLYVNGRWVKLPLDPALRLGRDEAGPAVEEPPTTAPEVSRETPEAPRPRPPRRARAPLAPPAPAPAVPGPTPEAQAVAAFQERATQEQADRAAALLAELQRRRALEEDDELVILALARLLTE